MWLPLGLLLLLLAVTYFHVIQGMFSALLSAVLAILCSVLAFATFEYIAVHVLASFKPDYALGLSLMGMFILPLLILRVTLDKLVHRACLLPLVVDKAGGLVFGVVAAYVMVGMLGICLQLIPFGTGVLTFARVDREDPTKEQHELWLKSDRFVVKLASMLSDGVLSGERSFTEIHPDFMTEVGWIEGVVPRPKKEGIPGVRRGVRRFAPPGSMRVLAVSDDETYIYRWIAPKRREPDPTLEPKKADPGNKFIRVQMALEPEAQDADKQHRFTLFQVRLVGKRGDDPEQYHAIAAADPEEGDKLIYDIKGQSDMPFVGWLLKPARVGGKAVVDVAFEVPSDFTPDFIEYKSGARDILKLGKRIVGSEASGEGAAGSASTPGAVPPSQAQARRGRVTGLAVTGSFFGDSFPDGLVMTAYQSRDVEINNARDALTSGHLHGTLDKQGKRERNPPVARFAVPDDKRLFHLSTESLQAGSMLGKALNLAITTVQNYVVTDSAGRQYIPVGAYVIAKLGTTPYVEIQYFPEYAEQAGRGLYPWARLRQNHLRGDYTLVYLYLIDPGAKLTRFSTGGSSSRSVDLSTMNLVAPK
ncbi:MAG: CvpA family protein [Phycisphaerae bacterium]|nr:CvpA family protein [Phycisphaerae bacterium]